MTIRLGPHPWFQTFSQFLNRYQIIISPRRLIMKRPRCIFRRSTIFCLLLILLMPYLAAAQTAQTINVAPTNTAQGSVQNPPVKLSPGAEEVARVIGVTPLLMKLYSLPESDRGVN